MTKQVLIVDDELLIRRALSKAFQLAGWQVANVGSGEEALSLIGEQVFQLLLVDVIMPGVSGIELIQQIDPKVRQQSCVVFMSAFPGSHQAELDSLAQAFIPKPFDDIFALVKQCESIEAEFSRNR